jgi:hypothetical protein
MPHVEFSRAGVDPIVATGPARVVRWADLYSVGPSRGGNLAVSRMDGRHPLGRERDQMAATLRWYITGESKLDGTAGASASLQVRLNLRAVQGWFDEAPGRMFTVTLDADGMVLEGEAAHEEWGELTWSGATVRVSQLVTVSEGILAEVVE